MATRVHELARKLGIESKAVLALAREAGLYVKSASSVLQEPDVRAITERAGYTVEPPPNPSPMRPYVQVPAQPPARSLQAEVNLLKRKSTRGKRYKGHVDAATAHFLDEHEAHEPPYVDEYERANAKTRAWLDLAFVAPEEIVRWCVECPGISPAAGVALIAAGASPAVAKTRWDGRALNPKGEFELYRSMSRGDFWPTLTGAPPRLSPENGIWLLRAAKLVA